MLNLLPNVFISKFLEQCYKVETFFELATVPGLSAKDMINS